MFKFEAQMCTYKLNALSCKLRAASCTKVGECEGARFEDEGNERGKKRSTTKKEDENDIRFAKYHIRLYVLSVIFSSCCHQGYLLLLKIKRELLHYQLNRVILLLATARGQMHTKCIVKNKKQRAENHTRAALLLNALYFRGFF